MYTKLRIILTQYGGTEVVACIWVGMADATIASTCIHYNGHLICVQGPVVGEINIFPLILFHLACGNLTCQSKIRKNRIFCQHYWHSHILHFFWLQKAGSPISGKALFQHDQAGATDYGYCLSCMYVRVVTKISSCQVNTTSRHGIMQLGSSFLSYFPSIFFFAVLGQFYAEIIIYYFYPCRMVLHVHKKIPNKFHFEIILAGIKTWKSWPNIFKLHSMAILVIHCNRQQETVSMSK